MSSKFFLFTTFQYYSMILLNVLFIITVYYFENPWIMIFVFYTVIPIIDDYIGADEENPTKEQMKLLKKDDFRFKLPIYLNVLVDWLVLIWTIWYLESYKPNFMMAAGIIYVTCNFQGGSINLSHEINHKANVFDNVVGTINLAKSLYMHFFIEHNYGHHKNVATPIDPASANYNQSLFSFLPQTYIGSFISAWRIENDRCKSRYKTSLTINNKMIWISLSYLIMPYLIYHFVSLYSMLIFILIAAVSSLFLEIINYVEHYGLRRKELSPGVYEDVTIRHSWNAPQMLSNFMLYKLQRHSDHHENSMKPYQTLCTYKQSPTLPHAYSMCLLMASVPPVWFDVMNPVLESYKNGEGPDQELLRATKRKIWRFIIYESILNTIFIALQIINNRVSSSQSQINA